jgi:hypothetical protein
MAEKNDELLSLTDTDPKETAKEMAKSISKMFEDMDTKSANAKQSLLDQLDVTSNKYRTANGVMSVLGCLRDVLGENAKEYMLEEEIGYAKTIATEMAKVAEEMWNTASSLDPEEMYLLCEAFYDKTFSEGNASGFDMVKELMTLQLCQNVGPNAEDITEFCKHADEEIVKARENLVDFCNVNDINFNELCGPHENCYECLCESCEKDCKSHKVIQDGQSAYDVCKDFVESE